MTLKGWKAVVFFVLPLILGYFTLGVLLARLVEVVW